MDTVKTFKDLLVWQESRRLVLDVYSISKSFPKEEIFGLTSQMRRASISISSNIAEGFARETYKDKIRFYFIARGSCVELENQLVLAEDLNYLKIEAYQLVCDQLNKVNALLNGLIKKSKTYL